MGVGAVGGVGARDIARLYGAAGQPDAPRASFADTLRTALQEVNGLQARRDDAVSGMVAGTVSEPHDVMVAAEEAQLAFELMLEVRNRLLESYQEVMRMQV